MELSNPTLLFSVDAIIEEALRDRIEEGSTYLVRAPHWEAFDRLVAQLVFGVVAVDHEMLLDDEGELDPGKLERLIEEAIESNAHVRILVFNVADEETLGILLNAGIHNVMRSPFSLEELELRLQSSGEKYGWLAERNYLVGKSGHIFRVDDIIGDSPQMAEVLSQVEKVAQSKSPVLVTGETGVGKELIAAAIHYNSQRRDGPFIKVNCAALQDTLLESDLFGHEKGSFTGAERQRIGRFEQAHGGTLFMDEIGEMSPAVQAKVLRILETQEFERVGGTRLIRVEVRLIAATNRVLEEAIRTGAFREDLFYRLNVVTIHIPPLRERPTDIPQLAKFFLRKARIEERRQVLDFTRDAMAFMETYPWLGNVRELENTVHQAVLLAETDHIHAQDLSILRRYETPAAGPASATAAVGIPYTPTDGPEPAIDSVDHPTSPGSDAPVGPTPTAAPDGMNLQEMEKVAILAALEETAYVQSRAARLLGISRRALNYKIAKYGITHPSWRVHRGE
jgi:Nif-specific regulatory protein